MPSGSRQAIAPAWTMREAPLKAVHMMRLKSPQTDEPSLNLSSLGTTVHPRRTPVKPAYLERELTSMQQVREPSISKMDLGTSSDLTKGAYAASYTTIEPCSLAQSISCLHCALVAAAPVGLLGEQK